MEIPILPETDPYDSEDEPRKPGELSENEMWWRDQQGWLQERGFMLRPRYRPGWVPSWSSGKAEFYDVEDGIRINNPYIMDATRTSDGTTVVLKKVLRNVHPYEVGIALFFGSGPLSKDPRNLCVPICEVLQAPDDANIQILVMPILCKFFYPRFLTIGEAVEFFRQTFEGLQFLHEHRVAHRDISYLNIMMDAQPLFPDLFHFARPTQNRTLTWWARHSTRTRCRVKYHFIDFGLSRKFKLGSGPPLARPIWGGDRSVPEFHKSRQPCDPFPTDIYYMGNVILEMFLQRYHGLEFMQPLVDDMVQDNPEKRPSMQQVVARFEPILASLSTWQLRSRLPERGEDWLLRSLRVIAHVYRTIIYVITLRPALPKPNCA